jgi:hypothetical protein
MPEELGSKRVYSISALPNRIVCLSGDDMSRLKNLASAVRETVKQLIDEENKKVLSYAQSLPAEPFYTQVDPPVKIATDQNVGQKRLKW